MSESLRAAQAQAVQSVTDYFQSKADNLPFEVAAYDLFNWSIQRAIESCATGDIQLKLAQIKFLANQRFDQNRRGIL